MSAKIDSGAWTGLDPARAAPKGISARTRLRIGMAGLVLAGIMLALAAFQFFSDRNAGEALGSALMAAATMVMSANLVRDVAEQKVREAVEDTDDACRHSMLDAR